MQSGHRRRIFNISSDAVSAPVALDQATGADTAISANTVRHTAALKCTGPAKEYDVRKKPRKSTTKTARLHRKNNARSLPATASTSVNRPTRVE